MRELLAELTRSLQQGRDCVHCSVVETRGSTPQKAGAAMLVFADGGQSGTLGGGCVEAEVKQRALRVLSEGAGRPEVFSFCLDDDYGWDDGLICGGRMTILAQPLVFESVRECGSSTGSGPTLTLSHSPTLPLSHAYYRRFHELVQRGQGCTEAIVVTEQPGVPVGSRYLFNAAAELVGQTATVPPPSLIGEQLPPLAQRPRPSVHKGIAYLPVLPRITLLIVGGGHVGQAVGKLATDVDFDVWVLDDRERYASHERFPQAQRLIVGDIGTTLQELARTAINPSMYCIIVTRGHAHDEEALYHLATTPAGYVGLIGSKRKIKMIYQDLIAKRIPEAALARVHAPLGFAIGSQTVPEIAVSIVAELIAHRNVGAAEQAHLKDWKFSTARER
jgi:xanthine dehydrogenase accessory factor